MVNANFQHDGNFGLLIVETHFGQKNAIPCSKNTDESFRLGGTAINTVSCYEGIILKLSQNDVPFRGFRTSTDAFENTGVLSAEDWDISDLHCYITEYYDLDMEGRSHGWFISKNPIVDANYLFINLDVIDSGLNVVKRYRVSPFTGEYKII